MVIHLYTGDFVFFYLPAVTKYGNENHKIAKYRWMAAYFKPLFQSYRRTSSDWNSSRIQDCM